MATDIIRPMCEILVICGIAGVSPLLAFVRPIYNFVEEYSISFKKRVQVTDEMRCYPVLKEL